MSIKQKTISGLIWTFTDTFLVRGMSFIASLILARLIGPEEFGLIGMITIFMAMGVSLVDGGMTSSIIRTKKTDNRDYSTVFYVNLGVSIIVYVILFVLAPYISAFYNQNVLTNIIRIYCLSFITSAFSAVQLAILNKEMNFRSIVKCNAPATLIGSLVGVYLGIHNYGVWSIVIMFLCIQIITSMLLWYFSSWRPTLLFSFEKLKLHFKFGYKLMLSGLLDIIFNNSYNVIIGKMFPVQILGYYERSKTLSDYPSTTISGVLGRVTYPMMVKIQDDTKKLNKFYKNILQTLFFMITPLMFGLAAIAKPIFLFILGKDWLHAVPFFQILCISSILYPIHSLNINVLKVFGRSDLFLKLEVVKKLVIVIGIIIGIQFGIMGLVWSSVVSSFLALLINTHYSGKMINYNTKSQLMDMIPVLIISSLIFLLMSRLIFYMENYSLIVQICVSSVVGCIIYLLINYLFKIKAMMFSLNLIKIKKYDSSK